MVSSRTVVAACASAKTSLPGNRVGLERIVIDVYWGRGIARASTTTTAGSVPSIAAEKTYVVVDLVANHASGLYVILCASKHLTFEKAGYADDNERTKLRVGPHDADEGNFRTGHASNNKNARWVCAALAVSRDDLSHSFVDRNWLQHTTELDLGQKVASLLDSRRFGVEVEERT